AQTLNSLTIGWQDPPMSVSVEHELSAELNERLRMEVGWQDVGKGLSQVLFGYVTIFVGVAVGVGLVLISPYGMGGQIRTGRTPSLASLWQFYIGMGILSVIGLIGYIIIIGGQFKCMMGAAERHGARWFMFACITCLLIGPAFHFTSGFAGLQRYPELKRG